jgi:hypothetical protein
VNASSEAGGERDDQVLPWTARLRVKQSHVGTIRFQCVSAPPVRADRKTHLTAGRDPSNLSTDFAISHQNKDFDDNYG